MSIDSANFDHLYQQVAGDLRRQILGGQLPSGSRLPSHRELVTRYGVSLMTINKALTVLTSEGLVHGRVGRGTFVTHDAPGGQAEGRKLLGLILRDLGDPFLVRMAQAAQTRAESAGFEVFLTAGATHAMREEEQVKRLVELGMTGLIISSSRDGVEMAGSFRALRQAEVPFVVVSSSPDGNSPCVGTDLRRAGEMAAEHLAGRGYRSFGYLSGRPGKPADDLRREGYRRALERLGHSLDRRFDWSYPNPFPGEQNHYRSGYEIGERIAAGSERPEAMFVYSDWGAIGLIDALLDRGLRVPEDVAVVGMDGAEHGERSRVPLTTLRSPAEQVGAVAVDSLIAQLGGTPPPARTLLEPQLVVRGSSG